MAELDRDKDANGVTVRPPPGAKGKPADAPASLEKQSDHPCFDCVLCCSYVALEIDAPDTMKEYDYIVWYLYHQGVSVFVDWDSNWYIKFEARCGQLTPQGLERTYRGDVFDNPLQRIDQQLISVRRRPGHDGATVVATAVTSGQQTWESRIGMRPASAPQVDVAQGTVAVITTEGMFFQLDRAEFQRGIAAPPQAPSTSPDEIVALTERIDLGGQRTAFASAAGNRNLLVCDLGEERA